MNGMRFVMNNYIRQSRQELYAKVHYDFSIMFVTDDNINNKTNY